MAHHNTVFARLLKYIPRHEFEILANQHHTGRRFRTTSRWSQFVALTLAQLSGRTSMRDIVANVSAQAHRLYHLGSAVLSRSNLSWINKHKLYSLDASTVDLCLSKFPWANFCTTKGAIKRHVGLDNDGYLPEFVTLTDGKTTDIETGRILAFPSGSIVGYDRG